MYDIAIGAGGLGFDSRVGLIGHSVASGLPPLRRFFGAVLPGPKPRKWVPVLVARFGVITRVYNEDLIFFRIM